MQFTRHKNYALTGTMKLLISIHIKYITLPPSTMFGSCKAISLSELLIFELVFFCAICTCVC